MIKNSLKYLLLAILISSGLLAQVQVGSPILGAASGDYFGENADINGNGTIVAGFGLNHDSNKGHVRVFQYTPTGNASWTQMGGDIDGEATGDNGVIQEGSNNIALNYAGNILAFGSVNNDGAASNAGSVRVYQFTSGSWTQMGSDIDGEVAEDNFGISVDLSDDGHTLVVGAIHHESDAGTANVGAIYVYKWNGSTWQEIGLMHGDESANYRLGNAVSINNDGTIVAGSTRRGPNDKGEVKIFQHTPSGSTSWTQMRV